MLSAAKKHKAAPSVRQPSGRLPPSGPPEHAGVKLCLSLVKGQLSVELERPSQVVPGIIAEQLSVRLPDVKFPLDLSGGVARFRHRRGLLAAGTLLVDLPELARHLQPLLATAMARPSVRLELTPMPWGIAVGLGDQLAALAFDLVVAENEQSVRLVVEGARAAGIDEIPQALALRLVGKVLGRFAVRAGSVFTVPDPLLVVARHLLPDAGARAPGSSPLRVRLDLQQQRWMLSGAYQLEGSALHSRAVRALEAAELLAEADDALCIGDLDAARAMFVVALERAPRHAGAAARLAALDLAAGGRVEAALATLVEVGSATAAGLLGAELLRLSGDQGGAYLAFAEAAEQEGFGLLSGLAWLLASRVTDSPRDVRFALDQAIVRAPSLLLARFERLTAVLAAGDRSQALADAQHIEATASGATERFEVTHRLAESFHRGGFLPEAQRYYERALRYQPTSPEAVAGLARSMTDLGRSDRALDLFARACELAERQRVPRWDLTLELAEQLARVAKEPSLAIARVAAVPPDAHEAPRARLLEARYRADIGDDAGCARSLARLRLLCERQPVPSDAARSLAPLLVAAAQIEADLRRDLVAAERDLVLALRLDSQNPEARSRLRQLAHEQARLAPQAQPPQPLGPQTEVPPAPPQPSVETPGISDEELVERGTERLRADPNDHQNAAQLAAALERLGRDLDLLALLSAQIEEASEERAPGLLEIRKRTLLRLAQTAETEGRPSEADLYRSMADT